MIQGNMTLQEAMRILGITDTHISQDEVKKIYRALLKKWHPDLCPAGKEDLYNNKTAEINAAYDVIEKAYSEGRMGPNARAYQSASYNGNTNASSSSASSNNKTYTYTNTYSSGTRTYTYTYTSSGWKHTGSSDSSGFSESSDNNQSKKTEPFSLSRLLSMPFDRTLFSLIILFGIFSLIEFFGLAAAITSKNFIVSQVVPFLLIEMIALFYGWNLWKFLNNWSYHIFINTILAIIFTSMLDSVLSFLLKAIGTLPQFAFTLIFYGLWGIIEYNVNIPKIKEAKDKSGTLEKFMALILVIEYATVFGSALIAGVLSLLAK